MSKTKFSRRILRKGAWELDLPPPTELLAMCATCKFFSFKDNYRRGGKVG